MQTGKRLSSVLRQKAYWLLKQVSGFSFELP